MNARNTIMINGTDHELDDEFLSHVLETAVEGACSYWADVSAESTGDAAGSDGARDFDVSDYVDDDADIDDNRVTYTAASFLVSKDPTQGGTLDLHGIADAIERITDGEVQVPPAIREIIVDAVENGDASDIDAEAADCIVQVGLFDELVFG
jgi:hypothetical protein